MSATIPDDWRIVRALEEVANPNAGTTYGQPFFTRWTYICYDGNDQWVCASGSEDDCLSQAISVYQSRKQGGG